MMTKRALYLGVGAVAIAVLWVGSVVELGAQQAARCRRGLRHFDAGWKIWSRRFLAPSAKTSRSILITSLKK